MCSKKVALNSGEGIPTLMVYTPARRLLGIAHLLYLQR